MYVLLLGLLGTLLPLPRSVLEPDTLARFEYRQRHMGVEARIVLYAPREALAAAAAGRAFARIAVLDSLMSDYRPDSELMRLSAGAGGPPVPVSGELFHILSVAQRLARLSDGAFDVTAGPHVRLWRAARRSRALPPPEELHTAAARTGWMYLHLDSATRSVRLARPEMQLDLGGIGKGYAIDQALATLRAHGVERALVEMGGDIVAGEPPPGEAGWRLHLANAPDGGEFVLLSRSAISTSGDTEQFVEIGGRRYSHIVDPRTGLGLQTRLGVTVIAPDATTADGLSTLLSVLGPGRAEAFVAEHFPGVTAYLRRASN